jgi:hypothetical protein
VLLTNSQVKPTFFNLDVNTSYDFDIDAVKCIVFARVFNLLDIRNEVNVFDDTGRAGFTSDQAYSEQHSPTPKVNSFAQWYTRPGNYSEPRRIEFGMNLEF